MADKGLISIILDMSYLLIRKITTAMEKQATDKNKHLT